MELLEQQFGQLLEHVARGGAGNQASLLSAQLYLATVVEDGFLSSVLRPIDRSEAEVSERIVAAFADLTDMGRRTFDVLVAFGDALDDGVRGSLRDIEQAREWANVLWLVASMAHDDNLAGLLRDHVNLRALSEARGSFMDLVDEEVRRDLGTPRLGLLLLRSMARAAEGPHIDERGEGRATHARVWFSVLYRLTWRTHARRCPLSEEEAPALVLRTFHQQLIKQARRGISHDHILGRYADWATRIEYEKLVRIIAGAKRAGGQDEHRLCLHLATYLHLCGLDPWTEPWLGARRADVLSRLGSEAVAIEAKLVRSGDDAGTIAHRIEDGIRKAKSAADIMQQSRAYLVVYWCDAADPGHPLVDAAADRVTTFFVQLAPAWASHKRRERPHKKTTPSL
ncbi:MAG: hypothetical protein Q8P41_04915 [Pseudomonadota bacterium]|nr:hypothetical protein [Pseudomonadota bacterium]